LLSFGAESFVFQFAIQKYKYFKIYRTTNLSVVFYGCETWSLTLREKRADGAREYGAEEDISP
jgi:hypothetical protein